MRALLKILIPTLAAAALISACGSRSSGSSSAASSTKSGGAAQVKTASNAKLGGSILVDARGLTLYRLSGEAKGRFICTSACLQVWHPLAARGATPNGTVGSLGEVQRPDGTEQVTYRGQPLYTFADDHAPGQINGEGVKDVGTWDAVTTSAAKASAPAPASTPASGSSGYAY
jgi:predicted lipoprotein with Yx(FWY)xxD motif